LPFSSGGGAEKVHKLIYNGFKSEFKQYNFVISEYKTYKELIRFIQDKNSREEKYFIGWLYYGGLLSLLLNIIYPCQRTIISLHSRVNKNLEGIPVKLSRIVMSVIMDTKKTMVVLPNQFALDDHIKVGFPRNNLKVIFNGIIQKKDLIELEKKTYLKNNSSFNIGVLARNNKYKNLTAAIEAFDILDSKNFKEIKLFIKGKDSNKLENQLSNLKRKNIFIDPSTNNIEDFFKRIHILLLPSICECSPLVVTESIARGVRVVSTPTGDVSRLIGNYGTISKRFDKYSIAEAIKKEMNLNKEILFNTSHYSKMINHSFKTSNFYKMKDEFMKLLV
jgi:glycosyltransferase involved in cell wall biosynthesis